MTRLLLVIAVTSSACMIVEDDPIVREVPTPVPVPVPGPVPRGFPGSGQGGDPGTDVLFLVRVDTGLTNIARHYETTVADAVAQLAASGIGVRNVVVGSLYGGGLLWGQGPTLFPPASLADVLRYHAQRAGDRIPPVCTLRTLEAIGLAFPALRVFYPAELLADVGHGGAPPGQALTSDRPFSTPPSALLVGLLEHGPRPYPMDTAPCRPSGLDAVTYFGGSDPAEWLMMTSGERLPLTQTRFLVVATAEGTSESATNLCLDTPGFPREVAGVIASSQIPFLGPWTSGMSERSPGLASMYDFCAALGGNWPTAMKAFSEVWAGELKKLPPATP